MGVLEVLEPLLTVLPGGGGMSLPKGMTTFGAALAALSVILLTSGATLLAGSYLARLNTPTGWPLKRP